ncbi:phospholipase D-like protein [Labedella gwakjiensis]|uniref:PLDc_N domain-containing protein n=1 Tax=Labedella gwakjiensis TaxID=390269 RepID=A0A2P8GZ90_9MICO|nr:PLD nuclease N-terminal domain-containing protein [Labedella gwakjiensis]PSL39286.1 phospholipase D-like protein [Labedella gwakjiensis]RUQ86291.1 PLDc_N domain-containing protein [Labedella gwakjiensis]
MYLLISAVTFLVLLAALIDIITRTDDQVKHLPKLFWIVLVILLPFLGSILWFTVGREWGDARESVSFGDPRRWDRSTAPTEAAPPARMQRELSTEEQLAALDREAEYYEKQARIRRLEADLDSKRQSEG